MAIIIVSYSFVTKSVPIESLLHIICASIGKDSESQCGKLVKRFGGSKVLIHYGGGSVIKSGLLDRVKASLSEEGIDYLAHTCCYGDGSGSGKVYGFTVLEQSDVEAIYRLML